jgi:UDP-N-acetylmuramate dehydrogenase
MIQENVRLAQHSSYRIGGPAHYFCDASSADDVVRALSFAERESLPLFVLGGGTNIVFSDDGFPGLVLVPRLTDMVLRGTAITAGAGVMMADFLTFAADRGLSGLEWAGGLPRTLGGAIRGNAGAFGGEIGALIREVTSLRIGVGEPSYVRRSREECCFGYRTSVFKKQSTPEIILSATLELGRGKPDVIREAIAEKIQYRLTRHPMEYPNIGSMFKNVDVDAIPEPHRRAVAGHVKQDPRPVVPAGYLISGAGLRGVGCGGAMISPKHANFIVNVLDATAADVKALVTFVERTVRERFGVSLEREVLYV